MKKKSLKKRKEYNSDSEQNDLDENEWSLDEQELPADEIVQEPEIVDGKQQRLKLSNVVSKLLSVEDSSKPILSKKRHLETEIDDEKLAEKAKKILNAEKKVRQETGRVKPTHATTDYEKSLRKIATKGVVQLFNALRAAQKSTEDDSDKTLSKKAFLQSLSQPKEKQQVEFLKDDFGMKAPKHWDEEEEEIETV